MSHRHFLVRKYDYGLEERFKDICAMLFSGDYLVVKEYRPKEHYHVQGVSELCDRDFAKIQQEEITRKHRYIQEKKDARLCQNSAKAVNELGFQYMCKQKDSKLICTSLSDDVIADLQAKSDAHVEKLKNELHEYIHPKIDHLMRRLDGDKDALKKVIDNVKMLIIEFHHENKPTVQVRFSQLKDRAMNIVLRHPRCGVIERVHLASI